MLSLNILITPVPSNRKLFSCFKRTRPLLWSHSCPESPSHDHQVARSSDVLNHANYLLPAIWHLFPFSQKHWSSGETENHNQISRALINTAGSRSINTFQKQEDKSELPFRVSTDCVARSLRKEEKRGRLVFGGEEVKEEEKIPRLDKGYATDRKRRPQKQPKSAFW